LLVPSSPLLLSRLHGSHLRSNFEKTFCHDEKVLINMRWRCSRSRTATPRTSSFLPASFAWGLWSAVYLPRSPACACAQTIFVSLLFLFTVPFLFSRTLIGASSKSKKTCPQTMRDSWWSVCSPPFHSTITQLPSHLHVPYSEFFCDEKSNNKKFIMSWNNIRNDTCVALFRAIIP
jgi:hypothetical protein